MAPVIRAPRRGIRRHLGGGARTSAHHRGPPAVQKPRALSSSETSPCSNPGLRSCSGLTGRTVSIDDARVGGRREFCVSLLSENVASNCSVTMSIYGRWIDAERARRIAGDVALGQVAVGLLGILEAAALSGVTERQAGRLVALRFQLLAKRSAGPQAVGLLRSSSAPVRRRTF